MAKRNQKKGKGRRFTDLAKDQLAAQLNRLDREGTCEPWAAREVLGVDARPSQEDIAAALHRALHRWERDSADGGLSAQLHVLVSAADVLLRDLLA